MLHQQFKKNISKCVIKGVVILVALFASVHGAHAATISISPSSAKVSIGNIVSVKVIINTDGKAVNNSEGIVQFPSDLLEIVSVNKGASIFTLWVEEPKFSNFEGKVSFNGGLPNPGYIGGSGEVMSITFKAKKAGIASIVFSDSSIRQNDGLGTDILTAKQSGSIEIKVAEKIDDTPPAPVAGTPPAPIVSSPTHPDQGKWYNSNDLELTWKVPSDITAISTSIGHNPAALPTVVYDAVIDNKSIPDIEDGVWYFNIRFKNKNGWGAITHFKVQIDTVSPNSFKISFPHGNVSEDPRPIIYFNTTDTTSGIAYYEVKINEGTFNRISSSEVSSNPYSPTPQDPGKHQILVKAVDNANNETIQSGEFMVTAINTPEITDYSSEVQQGDLLRIRGTSYPLTNVEIVVEDSNGQKISQITNVQIDGSFGMIWAKNLDTGSYTIKARAIDKKDAKSEFSKPLALTVKKSALVSVSLMILNWLSLIVILILIIGGSVLLITYFINKNLKIRKAIRKEIKGAESSIHKAFKILRENAYDQIKMLEKAKTKRDLTREEERIIKDFQESLTKSEEYLEDEMSKIENIL